MPNRRVTTLLVVFLFLLAGIGGAVYFRQGALDRRALESRVRGIEAVLLGDHVTALDQVGRYLQRFGQDEDTEALFAYAKARRNIPLPNYKHQQQAIALLLATLKIEPGHHAGQRELLDLYDEIGYGQETLTLAKTILEDTPEDIVAIRAEIHALVRLRKFEEALSRVSHVAELMPTDIENHFLALSLMDRLNKPSNEIQAYFLAQKGLDPEDAPYQLIQAAAHELAGDRAKAIEWADRAADNVQADPTVIQFVNKFLNRLGLFDTSLRLLSRAAIASDDIQLRQSLARRLFEVGDVSSVIKRTNDVVLAEQDSEILSIRAMAYARLNEKAEVQSIVTELERRGEDPVARTWVPLLRALWLDDGQSAQHVVAVCTDALTQDDKNPLFHYFLGLANERLGENGQAIRSWQNAVRYAPAWVDPILRSGRLLASMGRTAEAENIAQEAIKRVPKKVSVAAAAAEIIGADLNGLTDSDQQRLLSLVTSVQAASPMEPRTLPLLIDLLARQEDAAAAKEKLEAAIAGDEGLPQKTLLQLASISMTHGFGLAEACYDKIASSVGLTPTLAYARAVAAHRDGDSEGGQQLLASAAKSAGNAIDWQLPTAQYLEVIGSEDATAIWATVANAGADNVAVQRRVLASKAAWADLDLIEEVIERLRISTGEDAVTWREAKARWLMLSDTSDKAAAEAIVIINDTMRSSIPQASRYTLMSSALERLNNVDGAIDNLSQAALLAPGSRPIGLELARLYQARGNTERATRLLEEVMDAEAASSTEIRQVATMFARQNDTERAIELLLELHPPEDRENPADLFLAQLYRRLNQLQKAEAIFNRVLNEAPTASAIEFAADLLGSQGRTKEAENVLAQLDDLELNPGIHELILAEYQRYYGTPDEANRWYQAAITAKNDSPIIWRSHIAFLMRTKEMARAVDMLEDASAACPDDESFKQLSNNLEILRGVATQAIAQPLILAAIEVPGQYEKALEALATLSETGENDYARLAVQFRQLTERYPSFLILKMQLIRLYGSLGSHDDASIIAALAMRDFPNEVEPALLAAGSFAQSGQWVEALGAAKEWRLRSINHPAAADLMKATAENRLDRSPEALDTLQPYLQEIDQDSTVYSPMLAQQARALIGTDKISEATELLGPKLESSLQWRMAWVRLAALDIQSTATSAAWLDQVAPKIPEDSIDERIALVAAWYELAERAEEDALYREKARSMLQVLVDRSDVTGRTILALAIVAERDKDFEAAETNYRMALQLDPNLAIASNNLAMRYIDRNEQLEDAVQMAKKAIAAAPNNANFHDTLAQAYVALGDFNSAIQNLTCAAELEPRERKWRDKIRLYEQQQRKSELSTPSTSLGVQLK